MRHKLPITYYLFGEADGMHFYGNSASLSPICFVFVSEIISTCIWWYVWRDGF